MSVGQIKPGYKRTELGVIPEDWEVAPLAQLSSIERGKFSARPRNDPRLYGGHIPFIQTGDVTRSNGAIATYTQSLNSDGLRVSRLFPKGTLFFTIAANIGDVGITQFEAACPDSLVAITPYDQTDKYWLLYELSRRKSEFESLASPGAQLNINLEKLRPYLLPVPLPNEQRAIATALSDVDALLAKLDQLITKKRDLKQATMQQLLTGQTRLPGFSGEWEVSRLGDVAHINPGINKPVSEMGSGVLYVTVQDLYNSNSVIVEQLGRIRLSAQETEQYALQAGDIIFGKSSVKRDGIAYPNIFRGASEPAVCTGFAYRTRAFVELADANYLFYVLRWEPTRRWLIEHSQASALTNINKAISDAIPISLPGLEEQTAIATALSDMDTELASLQARRDKTHALKQGMMQELLTGRIRLVGVGE